MATPDYIVGASISPEKIAWLKAFAPMSPSTALDLGCGAGLYSMWLAEKNWNVQALDIHLRPVPMVEFKSHNLESGLPFPDQSFKLVLAWDILEHLVNEKTMWSEISRVLRPGGILIGSVPHNADQRLHAYNLTFKHHTDKTHQREYSPEDIQKRMQEVGIKLIQTELKGPVSPQVLAEFVSVKWARYPVAKSLGILRRLGLLRFGELYGDVFFAGEKSA